MIVPCVFCAALRFSLPCQKIELILIHKSVTHRHNNNIKRSRTHTHNLLSSEAERQAHNLEVTGSKPVGGIPGVAQRERAWLITTRTQDRNLSPGLGLLDHNRATCLTGVAQRERAGLITPRSGVRITSPVNNIFLHVFYLFPFSISISISIYMQ